MIKRITVIMALLLILSITGGCNGGNGESEQVAISISPKDVTLLLGGQRTFTAVVSGISDQRVNWLATGGEIDDDGLYHATEQGTFEVTAVSKADPSKTAVATVNVLPSGGDDFEIDDFLDVTAWAGTVNMKVNGSWSSSGENNVITWEHRISEDITREYRLEDKAGRDWRRRSNSVVKVSGTINNRSTASTGGYGETKWSGTITVVPDTRDYLSINKSAQTYTIELYRFAASPIRTGIYEEDGELIETWDYGVTEIIITNQPLPRIGVNLAGNKVEKILVFPEWCGGGGDSGQPEELNATITWNFVPLVE